MEYSYSYGGQMMGTQSGKISGQAESKSGTAAVPSSGDQRPAGRFGTGKVPARIARTPVQNGVDKSQLPAKPAQVGPTISPKELQKWERVQAQLRARLGNESFDSWFGRCRLETVSKSQILVSVPTQFLRNWIKTHYRKILLELWQKQLADILTVDVIVRSAVRAANVAEPEDTTDASGQATTQRTMLPRSQAGDGGAYSPRPHVPGMIGKPIGSAMPAPGMPRGMADISTVGFAGSPLDPTFTFSTFVEGASNRMACAAARSVAEADGAAMRRFNPLFIHASVGLGKTHLLQAIAWAANERNHGVKILYLTAEYFMWRFASAIRDQAALSFKESLRDIDLLLIDDMQFLQGKAIQQEFCHLLNALIDSAKQVVVAADRPPAELESLDARVRSRLQGGVALEVKSPELTMRREMLELRCREAQRDDPNLDIAPGVLDFVAAKVSSSGRDVEGAFNQLLVQHRFSEGPVNMDAVEKMLGHLVQASEQRRVRVEDIQKVVSRHYNVSKNDLLSNRRTRVIVRPRQIAMYLSKILTPRSLPEIGRRFGGRDHTTVLHAVRKIEGMLKEDPKLAQEIELLKRLINDMGQ